MKPYKFQPILKSTIWGGERIASFKGVETEQKQIGESWEISGVPGNESVTVDRGLLEDNDLGLTLPQLIDRFKGALLGEKVYEKYGNQFPLLIKFIDSRQNLSVQVHPNDEQAQQRHGCPGKTEMWYIIKADEGARIYTGLSKPLTPSGYEEMVKNSPETFMDYMSTQESHDGDLFFLPAGRLHAIGAGNFLAEIQETSDITYRVYDYNRLDKDGKPRQLHTEEARDVIDYEVHPSYRSSYDSTSPTSQLIDCPFFNVHRVVVQHAMEINYHVDSFVVVMCLWGDANVNGVHVRQGETLLVPACENTLYIFGSATFLTATM